MAGIGHGAFDVLRASNRVGQRARFAAFAEPRQGLQLLTVQNQAFDGPLQREGYATNCQITSDNRCGFGRFCGA